MSTIITITGYVFGVLACLLFFNLYNHYKTEEDARLDNIPFLKPWAIRLYRWSFYAPSSINRTLDATSRANPIS